MVPHQVYFFFFIFTFYRTNITDMVLYRLYTHCMHLNKDSLKVVCLHGRKGSWRQRKLNPTSLRKKKSEVNGESNRFPQTHQYVSKRDWKVSFQKEKSTIYKEIKWILIFVYWPCSTELGVSGCWCINNHIKNIRYTSKTSDKFHRIYKKQQQ